MFQAKATVIDFLGDKEKYPCHFKHELGDELIYDGEKYIGRICPHVTPMLIPRMMTLCAAGPRLISPLYYYPFWYSPLSRADESLKKYDGLGFRNVFETDAEPPFHMARLQPPNAFSWPPPNERNIARDEVVVCGDTRTSVAFKIEAFDLSDKGDAVPYFRRQMSILNKVLPKPGIDIDKILNEFSKDEIEIPYPALSPIMVQALSEELALVDYLNIDNGKASITPKGEAKLEAFRETLSAEEKEALNM